MGIMNGKTVVITGANAGIGKEAAVALTNLGATVVMACRNPERAAAAKAEIEHRSGRSVDSVSIDLASFDSIRSAAAELSDRYERLDVLVNNAGLIVGKRSTTPQGHEMIFGVNHLGTFLLTNLLLDTLRASGTARVVTVASGAHSFARSGLPFDDLNNERTNFRPMSVYAQSKLANILFTRELARKLSDSSVTANCLHPGFVGSHFARDGDVGKLGDIAMVLGRPFAISPAKGARTSVYLASDASVEGTTGEYFYKCKPHSVSKWAADDAAARRLWEISEQMCSLV